MNNVVAGMKYLSFTKKVRKITVYFRYLQNIERWAKPTEDWNQRNRLFWSASVL